MNYTFHNKFVIRTPLKPFKSSFKIEELRILFSKIDIQEALFLSSPDLLQECQKWLNNENEDNQAKLINSLLKYALRMHSRCTPFGLFASCAVVEWNDSLILNQKISKRQTKLDMDFSVSLAQKLSTTSFIQPFLKYYPNSSLYKIHNNIRFIDYYYKNNKRCYQICTIDDSQYVQKVIDKARSGGTIKELANILVEKDIDYEDAEEFILEIIESQVLVSELEPAVTGENVLFQIINKLIEVNTEENTSINELIVFLKNIEGRLTEIDEKSANSVNIYKTIAQDLERLNVPFSISKLFQTDLFRKIKYKSEKSEPQRNNLITELSKAIEVLNIFSKYQNTSDSYFNKFKERFFTRYEYKEVPLLEALDNEFGIGYGAKTSEQGDINPLIADISLPTQPSKSYKADWTEIQSLIFNKYINAKINKSKEIIFTEADLNTFEADWTDLPDTMTVFFNHIGNCESNEMINLTYIGNATASFLIGRFANANNEINEIVKTIVDVEQNCNRDIVLAEIAHLPENRIGNVISRPVFRQYEIPYLSNSTLPKERQITVDDLYISIRNNQLHLRSKKLNKQVIPRMGNAHNYSVNSLPVYHFLCDMQYNYKRGLLKFDWGSLKNELVFFPRVRFENIILSPAFWQLSKSHYKDLLEIEKEDRSILEHVKNWRMSFDFPDLILLAEGDNELLINLNNELSLKMFISVIKNKETITLKEFLYDENQSLIKDTDNKPYNNQIIAFLLKDVVKSKSKLIKEERTGSTQYVRSFSIGSEWLYYKLYCGIKTADVILVEVIKPLVENLVDKNLILKWFYIRYSDPDFHLRIRFHISDVTKIGLIIEIIKDVISDWEESGLIWKLQIDTYKREIERYGSSSIEQAEDFFYNDSSCVINMLKILDQEEEELKWLFAIRSIDEFLNNFNLNMKEKKELLETLKHLFENEFNVNQFLRAQLNQKYRLHKSKIADILTNKKPNDPNFGSLINHIDIRSRANLNSINEILKKQSDNSLDLTLTNLLSSYLHMQVNRIFRSNQRLHELVIYDFMWRAYRSEIAKEERLSAATLL